MAKQNVKISKANKKPSTMMIGIAKFFKSLFSNQAAIEASKTSKWWTIVIFILIAAMLPVIPLTVSAAKVDGSNYLGTNLQGMDTQLTLASEYFQENKQDFVIGEDQELHYLDEGEDVSASFKDQEEYADYSIYRNIGHVSGQIELEVFYTSDTREEVKHLVNYLTSDSYIMVKHSTEIKGKDSDVPAHDTYHPSFMILAKHGLYIYIYQNDSLTLSAYTNFTSDWKNVKKGTSIIDFTLDVDSKLVKGSTKYYEAVFDNWSVIVDKSYETSKGENVLRSTFIYLGIYLALVLFMGLMIFLLTRGKKNIFNYLKFWDCLKITAWASLCPAILAMILGFLLASYAVMFFIILLGLRMMWLSMKQLRPY